MVSVLDLKGSEKKKTIIAKSVQSLFQKVA